MGWFVLTLVRGETHHVAGKSDEWIVTSMALVMEGVRMNIGEPSFNTSKPALSASAGNPRPRLLDYGESLVEWYVLTSPQTNRAQRVSTRRLFWIPAQTARGWAWMYTDTIVSDLLPTFT